jgi:hypothetical protein
MLYWFFKEIWKWKFLYLNKIMFAALIILSQYTIYLTKKTNKVVKHIFYDYIIYLLLIILYTWLTILYKSIICYSYPFRIEKTADPYSYSSINHSAFIFDNIHIRICIHFENMKTNMGREISNPFPPLHTFTIQFWKLC